MRFFSFIVTHSNSVYSSFS